MRPSLFAAAVFSASLALIASSSAGATTLTGSNVIGSVTPLNGGLTVTTPFASEATVGSEGLTAVVHNNTFGQTFDIDADFNATGLTLSFTSPKPSSNLSIVSGDLLAVTFTDTSFGAAFPLSSYGCNGDPNSYCIFASNGLTSDTLSGSTVHLDFSNIYAGQVYTFTEPASVTPEPSSFLLLGTGLIGMAGMMRKRFADPLES